MVEPLFFQADLKSGDTVTLTGEEAKHAVSVRRMRIGEAIAVTNGAGLKIRGTVSALEKNSLTLEVLETTQDVAPDLKFVLVQALAKGDRDELAIQAATELGVSEVIPWQADRSVSIWEGKKRETGRNRWQQIVLEAAKQSLRSFVPKVHEVQSTAELAKSLDSFEMVILLDVSGTKSLKDLKLPSEGRIAIIVGPEGGISSEELKKLSSAELVSLGANVLRTSTAGPAVLAVLTLG
ncbi:MAG: 16S rRNA (uracil(1498)-N(3))-methyltransferase [Micrococcales bacterium]|nr:16S rRNA (uracil(1498)-N(3))-methyltransferase [Micrococcales bacterium]